MREEYLTPAVSQLSSYEKKIIDAIRESNGVIFRTELRSMVGGSNTTFIRKLLTLKHKGLIEEFKDRDPKSGRLKTAYSFTEHAMRLFNVEVSLTDKRWFFTMQKIVQFPEFNNLLRNILNDKTELCKSLEYNSHPLYLEGLLASNQRPKIKSSEIWKVLLLCNTFLHTVILEMLYPELNTEKTEREIEGYIVFRYRLEKRSEEIEALSKYISEYIHSPDPIDQHRKLSKIVELTIEKPHVISVLTLIALITAYYMGWNKMFIDLLEKYREYMFNDEVIQLSRIELILSVLTILKKVSEKV